MTAQHGGEDITTQPAKPKFHIHIEYRTLSLDFQGSAEQIGCVAVELAAIADLTVTIDDNVDSGLPTLPCSDLWK
ncbi:hypothetical protein [Nocardia heshunensis]